MHSFATQGSEPNFDLARARTIKTRKDVIAELARYHERGIVRSIGGRPCLTLEPKFSEAISELAIQGSRNASDFKKIDSSKSGTGGIKSYFITSGMLIGSVVSSISVYAFLGLHNPAILPLLILSTLTVLTASYLLMANKKAINYGREWLISLSKLIPELKKSQKADKDIAADEVSAETI